MPYLQRGGVVVRAHVLRSFVAAEEMPYAVPRAMPVGDARCPHILLRQRVQLVAACAARETRLLQSDMSLEDVGVVAFGLRGNLAAEPYGAGDVGGAIEILPARVEQEHAFGAHGGAGGGLGGVVDDSAVALVAGDGAERLIGEMLAHGAEVVQLIRYGAFGLHLPVGESLLFQPTEEAR